MMRKQNMSSPSPVTDGKRVFVMTGTGVFKAFDFKGTELWARDIQKDYGKFGLNWGYASSPLLYEDALYVQVLHGMKTDDPSYVLRIDPNTGKTTVAGRAADRGDPRVARLLHHAAPSRRPARRRGDRDHRRRRRHRPRSRHRQGAVARERPQSREQSLPPHRRLAGGDRRPDLRAVAREDDARAQAWRPRRRHDVAARSGRSIAAPTSRRPSATANTSTSSTTAACCTCSTRRPAPSIYGPQRLKSGTYSSSPVLADGKLYISNEDGVTRRGEGGPEVRGAGGEQARTSTRSARRRSPTVSSSSAPPVTSTASASASRRQRRATSRGLSRAVSQRSSTSLARRLTWEGRQPISPTGRSGTTGREAPAFFAHRSDLLGSETPIANNQLDRSGSRRFEELSFR